MIVFTCGETGGHVYPAIAIAQELTQPFCFIASQSRVDQDIIRKYQFPLFCLPLPPNRFTNIFSAFFQAREILVAEKTRLVVSSGGFLTMPVCLAAFTLRIPIFLLEQNAIPGRINRLLNWISTKNYVSFPQSIRYFSKNKTKCIGNPVRKIFLEDALSLELNQLSIAPQKTILVFGGSQGSYAINKLFHHQYHNLIQSPYLLIHIAGTRYFKEFFPSSPKIHIQKDVQGQIKLITMPYFEKMDTLYQLASVVICRAGATTLAELTAFQKPAILIPYPYARDNHQLLNATAFSQTNTAIIMPESEMSFEKMRDAVDKLSNAPQVHKPTPMSDARIQFLKEVKNWLNLIEK